MTRIGVAVVGLGVGLKHLQALTGLPQQFELRAVCDIDRSRAEAAAREFGAPRFALDLAQLLDDPTVQLVSLCTPPHLHLDQMRQCLHAGRDVVCEKPLVTSLAQLDELQVLQDQAARRVFPVFQVRWGQGFQRLRHLQSQGFARHAQVASVETHWRRDADYYAAAWRGRWASAGGGVCLTQAIHAHDLLTQVLGPVEQVYAQLATRAHPVEVEDCAAITLRLASGALASLSATLGAAGNSSRLRFVFGDVTVTSGAANPYRPGEDPWTFEARTPALQAAIDDALAACPPAAQGFAGQFESLYDTLTHGAPAAVTLQHARDALELVTAIYASADNGQPVSLPLPRNDPRRDCWAPAGGGFARGLADV
jgi:predicted dehydrogenase